MAGADEIPNMSTTRAPFPGSLTPGWNDPPTVTSGGNTNNTTPNRPRLNLKQRVAFPLDGLRRDNASISNPSTSTSTNSSTSTSTTTSSSGSSSNSENTMPGNTNAINIGRHTSSSLSSSSPLSLQGGLGNKPVAKVPPQVATMSAQQANNSSNALPPLPPLPPRADASTWPVATVHPRQK